MSNNSLPKPYYQDDSVTIYHADCRDILPLLPDKSIDLVLTDPPYGLGNQEWDKQMPYGILTYCLEHYDCPIVWFGSAPKLPADIRQFTVAPERVLVWCPRFTQSHTMRNKIAYRWHPIYLWRLHNNHNIRWDIIDIPTESWLPATRNWWYHPASKPSELISLLATLATGNGVILDPFLGSGTTAYCAKKLNRKCIGIEISEDYCRIAARRCSQAVLPLEVEQVQQGQGDSQPLMFPIMTPPTKGNKVRDKMSVNKVIKETNGE
uniref:Putative methyltransferase n=1 Tax=viral metagenome TaxID=1070528 RepID=A0A6M3XWI4_9ZZZZ